MNKRYLLPLMLTLVLLLAACGSGNEEAGSEAVTVTVKDEFNFDPATITVAPGQTVDITFENTGSVEHTFNILKADTELEHVLGEEEEEHLHEELLFDIHEVAPGESGSASFTAPDEPGDYTIACILPGHADAGMVGTLRVTP